MQLLGSSPLVGSSKASTPRATESSTLRDELLASTLQHVLHQFASFPRQGKNLCKLFLFFLALSPRHAHSSSTAFTPGDSTKFVTTHLRVCHCLGLQKGLTRISHPIVDTRTVGQASRPSRPIVQRTRLGFTHFANTANRHEQM